MLKFFRLLGKVIDREAAHKFKLFGLGAIGVAALEAIGVFFVLPLTQLLTQDEGDRMPAPARAVGRLFDISSTNGVALALALIVLITFIIKAVCAIALLRRSIKNSLMQEARVARRLFSAYLRAPYKYHLNRNSAEIQRTLNESLLLIFRRSMPWLLAAAADVVAVAAIAVVLVISDPAVAVIALVYFALVGFAYMRVVGGRQRAAAMASHHETARRYQQVQEPVRAVKEIAVLRRQSGFIERFNQTKLELVESQLVLAFYLVAPRHFLDVAFLIGAAIVAAFAFSTRTDAEALGTVGLFLAAGFRLVSPIHRIVGTGTMARTAGPALRQVVHDLAELKSVEMDAEGAAPRLEGSASVELDRVSFAYEGAEDVDVLDDVSLRIAPGDDVGFVGTTGSGKTTLIDLVLGLLDPTAGTVRIDDQPLSSCRSAWQRSIGYVPQEIVLTDDSIRANVAFGLPEREIDDDRVRSALRLAQIDDFVSTLPAGLDTAVGEDGVRMSGGQRQRLGLARALYNQPLVLVLDEATSALDSETEARVIDTIGAFHGKLTLISVAHRLSTLKHCDRIYFLAEGRIAAVGTFDELRALVPEFENLVSLGSLGSAPAPVQARVATNRNGAGWRHLRGRGSSPGAAARER